MKIPHNFAVNPVAAPRVRKVNDRTLQADAIMAQADQQMTATVGKVVGTANEIYQGHIQKQYDSDMVAGGAMLNQLKAKRDGEIASIPVDSNVDRAAEAKKINDRYNSEWNGWASKNIRNQNHRTISKAMQNGSDMFANDGATVSAQQGVIYDRSLNISNIEKADAITSSQLETNPFDQNLTQNLLANQDQYVAEGVKTEGEAAEAKKAIQNKVYEMRDTELVLGAENAILAGDNKKAAELFNQFSPLVSKEKRKSIETDAYKNQTYQKYVKSAREIDSFEKWDAWQKKVDEDPYVDKGSRQYQYLLNTYDKGIGDVNSNLRDLSVAEQNIGNFASAQVYQDQMRGISSGKKALMDQEIASTEVKHGLITATADEFTANGLKEILSVADKNEGKKMTLSDHASATKAARNKLNQTLESQYDNRAAAMKAAVEDGEWSSAIYSRMSEDDTANGFGVDDIDQFMEMGAAAANFRATEIDSKRIIDEVKETDDYKELDAEIGEGYMDPDGFKFDKFFKKIFGSNMNPSVQADLMYRAYEINSTKAQTYMSDGGGFMSRKRDISQPERDFRESLSTSFKELSKGNPSIARGLGSTYKQLDDLITKEGKKEKPDWESLFKKIQSQAVIKAITQ